MKKSNKASEYEEDASEVYFIFRINHVDISMRPAVRRAKRNRICDGDKTSDETGRSERCERHEERLSRR